MAPRLSRPPDPTDPAYQRLENRINFAVHVALFAAANSGMWFVRNILVADWNWSILLSSIWATTLLGHGIWVFATEKKLNQKMQEIEHE